MLTSLSSDCNLVQATGVLLLGGRPAPVHSRFVGYYEARVVDTSPLRRIALGFAPPDYALASLPGWDEHSYAFHADDCHAYSIHLPGSRQPFAVNVTVGAGSVVGCGFDRRKREVFFTIDGRFMGIAADRVDDTNFHATVGLGRAGDRVAVNFGAQPFLYAAMRAAAVSDRANRLARHHERVLVDADGLTAFKKRAGTGDDGSVLEDEAAIAQSLLPIIPKSSLQERLEEENSRHVLVLQPISAWPLIEAKFGPAEDEALVALVNRRCDRDENAVNLIDAPHEFALSSEERLSFSALSRPSLAVRTRAWCS